MDRAAAAIGSRTPVGSEPGSEPAGPVATIRPVTFADEPEFTALARRSREFHRRWIVAPTSPSEFARYLDRFDGPAAAGFVVCVAGTGAIAGFVNLNTIVGEPYCRGLLGYGAFVPYAGRGLMAAGLNAVVAHAFTALSLHRLEADVQPENEASVRLVQRLGFTLECVSPRFIRINGIWTDHQRWALTSDETE